MSVRLTSRVLESIRVAALLAESRSLVWETRLLACMKSEGRRVKNQEGFVVQHVLLNTNKRLHVPLPGTCKPAGGGTNRSLAFFRASSFRRRSRPFDEQSVSSLNWFSFLYLNSRSTSVLNYTSAPSFAKAIAVCLPMPSEAPVTSATFAS